MLLFWGKNIFKDQPGGEPYRKIIEADKTGNIVGSFTVIPGTKGEKPQNTAADKFNEHDAGTVKQPRRSTGQWRRRTERGPMTAASP